MDIISSGPTTAHGAARSHPPASTHKPRTTRLMFINTSKPQDATTPRSISRIRSHVAGDIHARARQKRKDSLQVRTLPPKPKQTPVVVLERNDQSHTPCVKPKGAREVAQAIAARPVSSGGSPPEEERTTAVGRWSGDVVAPKAPVGCGRTFNRAISEFENYMISCCEYRT